MRIGIYTIKDLVADECGPVFSAKNDEVASRNFRDLMKKENVGNSDEYRLYRIGFYDSEKMEVSMKGAMVLKVDGEETLYEFEEVNVKSWKQFNIEG